MGGEIKIVSVRCTYRSQKLNRIESLISQWVEVLPLYNEAHAAGRIPDCPTPKVILDRYEE